MSCVLEFSQQGALQALSRTCRWWAKEALLLAPAASRTLAQLTTWPSCLLQERSSALDAAAAERLLEVRRQGIIERIRMGFEDPEVVGTAKKKSWRKAEEDEDDVPLDGSRWFDQAAFRDRRLGESAVSSALNQAGGGDLSQLRLCSSSVCDHGLQRALEVHWDFLTHLCIGSGIGGKVSGAALAPLAARPRPRLQRLILVDVHEVRLDAIARACRNLRSVALRGGLLAPSSSVEALAGLTDLESLRLVLEPRVEQEAFVKVFSRCTRLSVIDIHGATELSDSLLGCLMLHVPGLQSFRGRHSGGVHMGASRALSLGMKNAFSRHFAKAQIWIDDISEESFL